MLDGIRVLDLTSVIAGPVMARTLADYSADVIKIEEPSDERPLFFPTMHIEVHRGKRHIVLDLKHPRGREIFFRLVATADVLIENSRRGVWDAQGLGYDDLIRVNPRLIYASLKAYGSTGPWGGWAGYEPNAQAATGLMVRFAGEQAPPSAIAGGAVNDYCTPLLGAFAIMLALRARRTDPRPYRIEAALAWTATLFQSADLHAMADPERPILGSRSRRGRSVRSRLWPAADGWVYAVFSEEALARFAQELAPQFGALDEETAARFEPVTMALTGEDLVAAASRCGGVATVAPYNAQLTQRLARVGAYSVDQYPAWGSVGHMDRTLSIEPPLTDLSRPAPGWGEHTRAILGELGVTAAEIEDLYDEGVVR